MIPQPLHPAVVHFPIVLMVLQPLAALIAIRAIRRGAAARTAWGITFALSAALFASAFVATRTGSADEEVVEDVVAEDVIEEHEESGERFMILSGIALGVATLGFVAGMVGQVGRFATLAGGAVLAFAGWQVGHSGGELVYQHGASSAHVARAEAGAGGDEAGAGGLFQQLFGGGESEGEENEGDEREEGDDD